VRYEPIDIPTFAAGLTAAGASEHFVQHISNVAQDYRDGVFAGVNDLVEVIGGVKPVTVEEYVEATRSRFDASDRPRR
jgi:NAD(P)H dehydrogenase (quinone)